jgi:hypothetical protein
MAQSVQSLSTGGRSRSQESEFESSLLHVVQTGSGAHPPYPMGTGSSFVGSKVAGAWSQPLISN